MKEESLGIGTKVVVMLVKDGKIVYCDGEKGYFWTNLKYRIKRRLGMKI